MVNLEREQKILDAAADLIIHQGYDKTTLGDVADVVGISRTTIYLHFPNKEALFEALIFREAAAYTQAWADYIEANPQSGTIGAIYRAVLYAINSRPFMSAVMRRDRRVIGRYLRKPDNLFARMQEASPWPDMVQALQEVGTIRQDIDAAVIAHIMDIISSGLISADEWKHPGEFPPVDRVMETIATMLDCFLTLEGANDNQIGQQIIRQLAAKTKQQFTQLLEQMEYQTQ